MSTRRTSATISPETATARAALKKYNAAIKSIKSAIAQCEGARTDTMAIYEAVMAGTDRGQRAELSEWRSHDKKQSDTIVASLKNALIHIDHALGPASAVGIYLSDD
jgi:hypothetical protein